MSLDYRIKRVDTMVKSWGLERDHDLIASLPLNKNTFDEFKVKIKLYVSKALNFEYENNDDLFMKKVNEARSNRKNVTPNGAVVPKREFQLEYNMVLRDWAKIIKEMVKRDEKLLSIFRFTPNVRIKYAKELEDNVGRALSTSYAHSDAWVEGPWGYNCYFPLLGDSDKNNLLFYEPNKGEFDEKMMAASPSYEDMQWVLKHYKKINFKPQKGKVYFSDYCMIHETHRANDCDTRISIDTGLYIGEHKPHADRMAEYSKSGIPDFGISTLIDPGQYEDDKPAEKKSVYSHYTSKVLKTIKLEK